MRKDWYKKTETELVRFAQGEVGKKGLTLTQSAKLAQSELLLRYEKDQEG